MNVGDLVYYIDRHYIVTGHINGKKWSLQSISSKNPYKTVTLLQKGNSIQGFYKRLLYPILAQGIHHA